MSINHNLVVITDHNQVITEDSLFAGIDWASTLNTLTKYAYKLELTQATGPYLDRLAEFYGVTRYISSGEEENDENNKNRD